MSVAQKFQRLGLVIVLLATAGYALATQEWALAMIAAALCTAGWMLTRGGSQRIVPAWLTSGLVWLAVARGVFVAIMGELDVPAFCEFLLGVIVVKMWDKKVAKDWSQALTLSAFLVIGSVLTGSSLATGVLLAVSVPLMVYGVILLQVIGAGQRAVAIVQGAGGEAPPAPDWDPLLGAQLRRAAMWSLMGGLCLSLLVFVIMPRDIGRGQFGRWLQTGARSISGFSETVQLGRSGTIFTSRENALDMAVKDAQGKNIGVAGRIFYVRGATMDQYDNGSWTRARQWQDHIESAFAGTPIAITRRTPGSSSSGDITQEFLIRSAGKRVPLFGLWQPLSLTLETGAEVAVNRADLTVVRQSGAPGPLRYTVVSGPGTARDGLQRTRRPGIDFPSARVREVASQILNLAAVEPDPATRPFEADSAAARAVETFLRDTFTYSLDQQPVPPGMDPIEWFLDIGKRGHCEYFASAMTGLLRSVGVNARMVTGYVAADFNSTSGHYTVRESNAHAWVEVEVHTGEWRQYDPTPPTTLREQHQPPRTLTSDFFGFLDAVEYAWVDSVVGFDETSRLRLFGGRGPTLPWFDRATTAISVRAYRGGGRLARDAAANGAVAFASVAAVGFVIYWIVRRQRRARRGPLWTPAGLSGAEQARLLSMAGFYEDLLRLWARAGRPKPVTQSPLTHAEDLAAGEEVENLSSRLSALFYKVRFGQQDLSPQELAQVRQDLSNLEEALRGRRLSGDRPGEKSSVRAS